MDQRCHLSAVWLTWIGLPTLALILGLRAGWTAGLVVLVVGVFAQIVYLRGFPRVSKLLGYGSVADTPAAPDALPPAISPVTLYTANVCPFCPIVRRRLAALQEHQPFEVREVDVTFRPDIIRQKGLRSVPVLEAGDRILVGNATSEQLAAFIAGEAAPSR